MTDPPPLTIILPTYNEAENLAELIPEIEDRFEGCPFRLLVVDDEADLRYVVRRNVEGMGCSLIEAEDGEAAWRLAKRYRPEVALVDLLLPKLDGLEVTRRLKANPATAAIPVVALTAYAQKEDEERAREAGCIGYIAKPIRLHLFPSQIEGFLKIEEGVA